MGEDGAFVAPSPLSFGPADPDAVPLGQILGNNPGKAPRVLPSSGAAADR